MYYLKCSLIIQMVSEHLYMHSDVPALYLTFTFYL